MNTIYPIGTVYYGHQVYEEYAGKRPVGLPNGAYIYEEWKGYGVWYTADFCPCLTEDVPAETRTLHLLVAR